MPRWSAPVRGRHRLRLRVSGVVAVVASAVAQVDTADERDVVDGLVPIVVPNDDKLLMVRSANAYPHVEQATAAGGFYFCAEASVLLGAERESVPVRSPHESVDDRAAGRSGGEHGTDGHAVGSYRFVRVAAPVGEVQGVIVCQLLRGRSQRGEVGRAMNQWTHLIA